MRSKKLIAILSLLLMISSCGRQEEDVRVILIGVDGMEWSIIHRLWQQGRLPNLKRLADNGSSGLLQSEEPSLSPCLWTTIASGRPRSEHGVIDFVYEDSYGVRRPINSKQVRCPRLWDIFSAAGLSCAVINWWATWPSRPVNGFLVSDYFWPVYVNEEHGWYVGSNPDFDFPQRTYPEELFDSLSDLIVTDRMLSAEEKEAIQAKRGWRNFKRRWFWPYCRDLTIHRVAKRLLPQRMPRFSAVYFQGVDTMQHWFWPAMSAEGFSGIPEEHYRDYGNAIYGYYEYADELLGFFLDLPWPNKVIILVSDHGFRSKNKDASRDVFWKLTDTECHGPNGVLVISGPMTRKRLRLPPSNIYDIFPTILHLLDQPLPHDIRGKIISAAFVPAYLEDRPASYIASYGFLAGNADDSAASPMDKHIIDNLKSIGYLQ